MPGFRMSRVFGTSAAASDCGTDGSNLLRLAESDRNDTEVLRYLETRHAGAPGNVEHRARRLEIRARTGRLEQVIADANWFTRNQVPGVDLECPRSSIVSRGTTGASKRLTRLQSPVIATADLSERNDNAFLLNSCEHGLYLIEMENQMSRFVCPHRQPSQVQGDVVVKRR